NALRYTPPENAGVKVTAAGENGRLNIQIQDHGIGMTPEELAQLGTPYFRADNELVLSYKGSGLGVPIAYGIIELLGSETSVVSQPGQGTTFTVSIMGMT